MEPERNDGLKPTVEASTVHYKKVKDRHTQIQRLVKVKHEDAEQEMHDWRQKVKVDPNSDAYRENSTGMMTEF